MSKRVLGLALFLALFLVQTKFYAGIENDHELIVPTEEGLTDFILADVDGNGNRLDLDRVYVLQRGGVYFMSALEPDFPLRLVAEEGAGARPIIYPTQNSQGTYPNFMITVNNNVYIKNIVLWATAEEDESIVSNSVMFVSSPGFDVVVDSCVFAGIKGQLIRTNAALRKLQITNSILANTGDPAVGVTGIGKGIDFRDVSCDTVIIRNNTWVNIADRIIRHRNSTEPLGYFEFDHNSIIQNMSYSGVLELGAVGPEVKVTNNLFINPYGFGRDLDDASRDIEFSGSASSNEREANGSVRMTILSAGSPEATTFIVKNNYLNYTQDLKDWWASRGIFEPHPLTWGIAKQLGADSVNAFIKEEGLTVNNMPALATELLDWYWDVAEKQSGQVTQDFDYDRKTIEYFTEGGEFDGKYPTNAAAYTGSDGSFPAGDLNWYPDKLQEWNEWKTVGIEEDHTITGLPTEFSLEQNYPNPFNPATTINFGLAQTAKVTLNVYNVLGQHVAQLVNEELNAGKYNYKFDASNLASGIYIYRLQANNFIQTRKMALIK